MGHISEPKCHVSITPLVAFSLAMTIEISDRQSGPFRLIFATFAILGQVGNTISPWGKGANQKGKAILVAYDQGSMALGFLFCYSGLAGVVQLTVRATLQDFAFLAVFCPVP